MNAVTANPGRAGWTKDHGAGPFRAHESVRRRIECFAPSVGAKHRSRTETDEDVRQQQRINAGSNRQVALSGFQTPDCPVHRHER